MYHLLYLSSARSLFSDEELIELLSKSRKNNSERNITGILLYCDGAILQVLEGEKDVVEALYARLLDDHRHHGIIQVIQGESEDRFFGDWSMGFRKMTSSQWDQLSGFIKPEDVIKPKDPGKISSQEVIVVIQSFVTANFSSRFIL